MRLLRTPDNTSFLYKANICETSENHVTSDNVPKLDSRSSIWSSVLNNNWSSKFNLPWSRTVTLIAVAGLPTESTSQDKYELVPVECRDNVIQDRGKNSERHSDKCIRSGPLSSKDSSTPLFITKCKRQRNAQQITDHSVDSKESSELLIWELVKRADSDNCTDISALATDGISSFSEMEKHRKWAQLTSKFSEEYLNKYSSNISPKCRKGNSPSTRNKSTTFSESEIRSVNYDSTSNSETYPIHCFKNIWNKSSDLEKVSKDNISASKKMNNINNDSPESYDIQLTLNNNNNNAENFGNCIVDIRKTANVQNLNTIMKQEFLEKNNFQKNTKLNNKSQCETKWNYEQAINNITSEEFRVQLYNMSKNNEAGIFYRGQESQESYSSGSDLESSYSCSNCNNLQQLRQILTSLNMQLSEKDLTSLISSDKIKNGVTSEISDKNNCHNVFSYSTGVNTMEKLQTNTSNFEIEPSYFSSSYESHLLKNLQNKLAAERQNNASNTYCIDIIKYVQNKLDELEQLMIAAKTLENANKRVNLNNNCKNSYEQNIKVAYRDKTVRLLDTTNTSSLKNAVSDSKREKKCDRENLFTHSTYQVYSLGSMENNVGINNSDQKLSNLEVHLRTCSPDCPIEEVLINLQNRITQLEQLIINMKHEADDDKNEINDIEESTAQKLQPNLVIEKNAENEEALQLEEDQKSVEDEILENIASLTSSEKKMVEVHKQFSLNGENEMHEQFNTNQQRSTTESLKGKPASPRRGTTTSLRKSDDILKKSSVGHSSKNLAKTIENEIDEFEETPKDASLELYTEQQRSTTESLKRKSASPRRSTTTSLRKSDDILKKSSVGRSSKNLAETIENEIDEFEKTPKDASLELYSEQQRSTTESLKGKSASPRRGTTTSLRKSDDILKKSSVGRSSKNLAETIENEIDEFEKTPKDASLELNSEQQRSTTESLKGKSASPRRGTTTSLRKSDDILKKSSVGHSSKNLAKTIENEIDEFEETHKDASLQLDTVHSRDTLTSLNDKHSSPRRSTITSLRDNADAFKKRSSMSHSNKDIQEEIPRNTQENAESSINFKKENADFDLISTDCNECRADCHRKTNITSSEGNVEKYLKRCRCNTILHKTIESKTTPLETDRKDSVELIKEPRKSIITSLTDNAKVYGRRSTDRSSKDLAKVIDNETEDLQETYKDASLEATTEQRKSNTGNLRDNVEIYEKRFSVEPSNKDITTTIEDAIEELEKIQEEFNTDQQRSTTENLKGKSASPRRSTTTSLRKSDDMIKKYSVGHSSKNLAETIENEIDEFEETPKDASLELYTEQQRSTTASLKRKSASPQRSSIASLKDSGDILKKSSTGRSSKNLAKVIENEIDEFEETPKDASLELYTEQQRSTTESLKRKSASPRRSTTTSLRKSDDILKKSSVGHTSKNLAETIESEIDEFEETPKDASLELYTEQQRSTTESLKRKSASPRRSTTTSLRKSDDILKKSSVGHSSKNLAATIENEIDEFEETPKDASLELYTEQQRSTTESLKRKSASPRRSTTTSLRKSDDIVKKSSVGHSSKNLAETIESEIDEFEETPKDASLELYTEQQRSTTESLKRKSASPRRSTTTSLRKSDDILKKSSVGHSSKNLAETIENEIDEFEETPKDASLELYTEQQRSTTESLKMKSASLRRSTTTSLRKSDDILKKSSVGHSSKNLAETIENEIDEFEETPKDASLELYTEQQRSTTESLKRKSASLRRSTTTSLRKSDDILKKSSVGRSSKNLAETIETGIEEFEETPKDASLELYTEQQRSITESLKGKSASSRRSTTTSLRKSDDILKKSSVGRSSKNLVETIENEIDEFEETPRDASLELYAEQQRSTTASLKGKSASQRSSIASVKDSGDILKKSSTGRSSKNLAKVIESEIEEFQETHKDAEHRRSTLTSLNNKPPLGTSTTTSLKNNDVSKHRFSMSRSSEVNHEDILIRVKETTESSTSIEKETVCSILRDGMECIADCHRNIILTNSKGDVETYKKPCPTDQCNKPRPRIIQNIIESSETTDTDVSEDKNKTDRRSLDDNGKTFKKRSIDHSSKDLSKVYIDPFAEPVAEHRSSTIGSLKDNIEIYDEPFIDSLEDKIDDRKSTITSLKNKSGFLRRSTTTSLKDNPDVLKSRPSMTHSSKISHEGELVDVELVSRSHHRNADELKKSSSINRSSNISHEKEFSNVELVSASHRSNISASLINNTELHDKRSSMVKHSSKDRANVIETEFDTFEETPKKESSELNTKRQASSTARARDDKKRPSIDYYDNDNQNNLSIEISLNIEPTSNLEKEIPHHVLVSHDGPKCLATCHRKSINRSLEDSIKVNTINCPCCTCAVGVSKDELLKRSRELEIASLHDNIKMRSSREVSHENAATSTTSEKEIGDFDITLQDEQAPRDLSRKTTFASLKSISDTENITKKSQEEFLVEVSANTESCASLEKAMADFDVVPADKASRTYLSKSHQRSTSISVKDNTLDSANKGLAKTNGNRSDEFLEIDTSLKTGHHKSGIESLENKRDSHSRSTSTSLKELYQNRSSKDHSSKNLLIQNKPDELEETDNDAFLELTTEHHRNVIASLKGIPHSPSKNTIASLKELNNKYSIDLPLEDDIEGTADKLTETLKDTSFEQNIHQRKSTIQSFKDKYNFSYKDKISSSKELHKKILSTGRSSRDHSEMNKNEIDEREKTLEVTTKYRTSSTSPKDRSGSLHQSTMESLKELYEKRSSIDRSIKDLTKIIENELNIGQADRDEALELTTEHHTTASMKHKSDSPLTGPITSLKELHKKGSHISCGCEELSGNEMDILAKNHKDISRELNKDSSRKSTITNLKGRVDSPRSGTITSVKDNAEIYEQISVHRSSKELANIADELEKTHEDLAPELDIHNRAIRRSINRSSTEQVDLIENELDELSNIGKGTSTELNMEHGSIISLKNKSGSPRKSPISSLKDIHKKRSSIYRSSKDLTKVIENEFEEPEDISAELPTEHRRSAATGSQSSNQEYKNIPIEVQERTKSTTTFEKEIADFDLVPTSEHPYPAVNDHKSSDENAAAYKKHYSLDYSREEFTQEMEVEMNANQKSSKDSSLELQTQLIKDNIGEEEEIHNDIPLELHTERRRSSRRSFKSVSDSLRKSICKDSSGLSKGSLTKASRNDSKSSEGKSTAKADKDIAKYYYNRMQSWESNTRVDCTCENLQHLTPDSSNITPSHTDAKPHDQNINTQTVVPKEITKDAKQDHSQMLVDATRKSKTSKSDDIDLKNTSHEEFSRLHDLESLRDNEDTSSLKTVYKDSSSVHKYSSTVMDTTFQDDITTPQEHAHDLASSDRFIKSKSGDSLTSSIKNYKLSSVKFGAIIIPEESDHHLYSSEKLTDDKPEESHIGSLKSNTVSSDHKKTSSLKFEELVTQIPEESVHSVSSSKELTKNKLGEFQTDSLKSSQKDVQTTNREIATKSEYTDDMQKPCYCDETIKTLQYKIEALEKINNEGVIQNLLNKMNAIEQTYLRNRSRTRQSKHDDLGVFFLSTETHEDPFHMSKRILAHDTTGGFGEKAKEADKDLKYRVHSSSRSRKSPSAMSKSIQTAQRKFKDKEIQQDDDCFGILDNPEKGMNEMCTEEQEELKILQLLLQSHLCAICRNQVKNASETVRIPQKGSAEEPLKKKSKCVKCLLINEHKLSYCGSHPLITNKSKRARDTNKNKLKHTHNGTCSKASCPSCTTSKSSLRKLKGKLEEQDNQQTPKSKNHWFLILCRLCCLK